MEKVLVIVGPTAVGKTALSIELAKKFNGEIISGDSLQVYQKLDIGTAKVTTEEMAGVPHHLIDVIEPTQRYSAADFQQSARQLIAEITARGHLPIIAGGTGLYIQSLLYDYQLGAADKQQDETKLVRQKYEAFADEYGKEALWTMLKEKDPEAAEKIHWNNQRKVVRALEVLETTGFSITAPKEQPKQLYDYYMIGLDTNREKLYERINLRVDLMLKAGLEDEARFVYQLGDTQASQGIGYKEFFPYFNGQDSLAEVVEQIKQNSRRYAKRQLTWFRNRLTAQWFDLIEQPEEQQVIETEIQKWLEESQ
ncbi:tRNA (adenosine(37)-N6)-dimethylallyltransferase MiaA [Candidatus Enterococcus courvalinii]|uniref:tRNA dimethylallyltransferase n=1 Tax=Candidatus Enterococcus courvalinii TaxID=2815329 RepID=A0ABS3I2F1_9ENTE|nr:tRNA (adenosine(37)-N6)-dimethylallyltransferase MiaA [Enterococcus sp. MSG2901]MBO0482882.1 tRNA (adenosine(37)-N6)-dimethylallyltransferase MiaA [Enterococcus sp. MSG2901]